MEPTGSRSPRIKKQKKETAFYFYINVQTKGTKGNRHQTMLPQQDIWPKYTQQQSHARWWRQVSPGQQLQLLSSTVPLTGGELINSRLSAGANIKTTQNRCKRDIKRLPLLCLWHGSWENSNVIDLFFVIQRKQYWRWSVCGCVREQSEQRSHLAWDLTQGKSAGLASPYQK